MTRSEIISAAKAQGGMLAVIPSAVMGDRALPMSARLLYGLLTWRSNKNAYCRSTNRQLGEEAGLSSKRVSALLSLLEERGHIHTERRSGQRRIFPLAPPAPEAEEAPGPEETPGQTGEGAVPKEGKPYKVKIKKDNSKIPPEVFFICRDYAGEDRELLLALLDLAENRAAISKPVKTPRAMQGILRRLDKLSEGDRQAKLAMLEEATVHNWLTVYAPKPERARFAREEGGTYL